MDDILVHSSTLEKHVHLLARVMKLLQQNGLYAKRSKCTFAHKRISYLWQVISEQGVSTDDSKVCIVRDWPVPDTVKKLHGFLGLAGDYH